MQNIRKVEIKQSPIHGRGVFASEDLEADIIIGHYRGPRAKRNGMYVLWITDEETGEEYGISGQNKLRYLNHSSKPNAYLNGEELSTITDVKKGEELTIHYGDGFDELAAN